jgi:hypothetical protein
MAKIGKLALENDGVDLFIFAEFLFQNAENYPFG